MPTRIVDEVPPGAHGVLVTLEGEEIEGTLDSLTGCGYVNFATRNPDGSLVLEYGDDTEVFWNDQKHAVNEHGEIIFRTINGRHVPASQVKIIPADEPFHNSPSE